MRVHWLLPLFSPLPSLYVFVSFWMFLLCYTFASNDPIVTFFKSRRPYDLYQVCLLLIPSIDHYLVLPGGLAERFIFSWFLGCILNDLRVISTRGCRVSFELELCGVGVHVLWFDLIGVCLFQGRIHVFCLVLSRIYNHFFGFHNVLQLLCVVQRRRVLFG